MTSHWDQEGYDRAWQGREESLSKQDFTCSSPVETLYQCSTFYYSSRSNSCLPLPSGFHRLCLSLSAFIPQNISVQYSQFLNR